MEKTKAPTILNPGCAQASTITRCLVWLEALNFLNSHHKMKGQNLSKINLALEKKSEIEAAWKEFQEICIKLAQPDTNLAYDAGFRANGGGLSALVLITEFRQEKSIRAMELLNSIINNKRKLKVDASMEMNLLKSVEMLAVNNGLKYYCDNSRHLVCIPYSITNLHRMARQFGKKECHYDAGGRNIHPHYDIPARRRIEIEAKCIRVTSKELFEIIKNNSEPNQPNNTPDTPNV